MILKSIAQNKGFTLIEMLISISLALIVMTIGIKTFGYFSATARLSEAKEMIDSTLVTANVNALTGKSFTADYYSDNSLYQNASLYQPSRYFLYFQKSQDDTEEKAWEKQNIIVYGELQKGVPEKTVTDHGRQKVIRKELENKNVYELIYVEQKEIPFPVFLQNILFSPSGETSDGDKDIGKSIDNVFLFFDPPFGNVIFLCDANVDVRIKNGDNFPHFKELLAVSKADYDQPLYLDLTGTTEEKGKVEFALQYKERTDITKDKEGGDKYYWMREYIEYDSRNQLSHYWD